jgi:hypothetical protein
MKITLLRTLARLGDALGPASLSAEGRRAPQPCKGGWSTTTCYGLGIEQLW